MLHSRYSRIKVCPLTDKQRLFIEIFVLQKICVHLEKDKTDVPDIS